jgi:hypothetical protein
LQIGTLISRRRSQESTQVLHPRVPSVDEITVERKRVPGEVLVEADRLECLVFLGYDPNLDGDEPPGL